MPSVVHVRELIRYDEWLQASIGETADSIIEQVLTRADWVVANSETTRKAFFKKERTFVVPNTVDTNALDIPNNVVGGVVKFGIISSNVAKKGINDVVELARACKSTIPNARFVIIGSESPLVQELRARQKARQIPTSVQFPGYAVSPREALDKVNVVLNFSHFAESFGRTVLEAMAARRPVIAYEWGALPELVVHDLTGFLIPFRQPLQALPAVKLLCERSEKIAEMGAAGRRIAEQRYSKREYARRLRNVYDPVFAELDNKRVGKLDRETGKPVGKDGRAEILPPRDRANTPLTLNQTQVAAEQHSELRIGYFCWHFPVPSETFVLTELRHLVAQGHDVVVFCRESPHGDFKPDFPIRWIRVSSPDELAQQLASWRRNVAHGHFTYPTVTEFLWPACEKANVPFTFIAHAQDIFRYVNDQKNRIGDVVKAPLCLRLFVLSRFHREYVIARGAPPEKVVINPNAIDISVFAGAKSEASRRETRSICAVHRFCEKKGLEFLIRAGKELERDGITVDLYGYGPLEETYRTIITELNLKNVRLCGRVKTRAELIEVFRRYDLFLCPSVRAADGDMDGIPTSIAEAMAAGLPVLTTAVSGIPDLVTDGVTGLVCEPTPQSIAAGVRRFYAMSASQVDAILEAAQRRVQEKHDVRRLVRVLLRVWQKKTVDIILVSWTHVEEHREVLRRIYEYTSLPFRVIVSANSERREVIEILESYAAEKDNFTLLRNGRNLFVGPGTNRAMAAGSSDIAIYVCGREGFPLRPGWELPFIHYMEENPDVGLAGTLCHSPTYLTGNEYVSKIPLFPQFRNPSFATKNSNRTFHHVQGGLFAIRRKMYDEIGGFSEAVPHDYTDVEFSFYAESCGWKLGQVPEIVSLFNKTRPPLGAWIDETTAAIHPSTLQTVAGFEAIARGENHNCNVCGWHGRSVGLELRTEAVCPRCGSRRADRTLYRWLTPSIFLHRRLPAIAVGLGGRIEQVWSEHFEGPRLGFAAFVDILKTRGGSQMNKPSLTWAFFVGGQAPQRPESSCLQNLRGCCVRGRFIDSANRRGSRRFWNRCKIIWL